MDRLVSQSLFTLTHLARTPGRHLALARGPANGPTLLLLHGVLRGWRDFAPLWPALVPGWHVHALDHRGHGDSSRADRYLVRDYADDVLALVRDQFPGPLVLYGHSLGAWVAVTVAAHLPDRVSAVILEDPPAPAFLLDVSASSWYDLWRQMQALAGSTAPLAELTRRLADLRVSGADGSLRRLGEVRDAASLRFSAAYLQRLDPAVLPPLLENRWLDGFDVAGTWAAVRCPTLLLRGDPALGGMLTRVQAEELLAPLSEGWLVDVPSAGHLIHWQAIEPTCRIVLGFLESLQVSS